MSVFRLALKELAYRKWHFLFCTLSVFVAVASLTGVLALLQRYDSQTKLILHDKQIDLEKRVTSINNDIQAAMAKLGFNIIILPKNQNLGDWYDKDYASKTMPQDYTQKLNRANMKTIENMVPCLREKIKWPETQWTIILIGVGKGKIKSSANIDNILCQEIPHGTVVLGHEIHKAQGLNVGDNVTIMNKQFKIAQCRKEQGSKDDVSIWLNLQDCQELLGKEGLINEIRALEAPCAWSQIAKVREEITRILPETQIIEISDLAATKTAIRTKALDDGNLAIQKEKEHRFKMQTAQRRLAWILLPIVLVICSGWLSLLSLRNVQDRTLEIGILTSLGYTIGEIIRLFLLRSLFLASLGGVTGFLLGVYLGSFAWYLLGVSLLVSVGITSFSAWICVIYVLRQDPAVILQSD